MFRIVYLPTAFLVPAYLDDVDYVFSTLEEALQTIKEDRVVYGSNGGSKFIDETDKHYIYINSSSTDGGLVSKHLLDVVEVE
jgi:hypothetical protein